MASEAVLELRFLGSMEASVTGGAGDRRLGKGKPVALLTYLALAPGKRASRERLATLLWSDGTSEGARQNLRQAIWYLKRRLGDVIVTDDDTMALAPGSTSDVDRFTAAAAEDRFADAVAAYHGDFAPEFAAPGAAAFEEWAELERRRLRAIYVACAESMARSLLGGGHANDAVRVAKRVRELAADDPTSWRLLLECLIAARDTLGIAATVAQLEAEIEREDLDADPALRSLIRAAKKLGLNGDVESGSVESPEQSLVPDLIGREAEFRTLVDAWEGARRGRGRALLLTGAAGLGKTRLLADFAARVTSTRGRTVQVRAHPGNRTIGSSLAAQISEALGALPGAAAISTGSASVLVALSPLLASSFPGAEPDRATGEDALRRRAAALGELLTVICENTPLALLVDDGHWADAESMRIVGALRARVEGARALLVVASRIPDDLRHHVGNVEELALKPLDVAGVAEFVGRLASLPTEPWSRGLVPRLHEVSHGIPLLLIETLQRLVESQALVRRNGHWSAVSAEALEAAMPPGSALQARLETLGVRERAALVRLATLGRPIAIAELLPDEMIPDWAPVLGELERRSFVTGSEQRVNAWHDEIARGVLDLATPEDRLQAHAWVAGLLVARAAAPTEFRLAALHALRAADDGMVERVWHLGLRFARKRGDSRSARLVATDLLPPELPEVQRARLIRSAPIALRISRTWRVGLAVTGFALAFVALWGATRSVSQETVRIYWQHETDSTSAWSLEVPLDGAWPVDEPLVVRKVAAARAPWRGTRAVRDLTWLPDGTGWITQQTFPDSTGDEVVRLGPDGALERLSFSPGDDNAATPSPDGRQLVFYSRGFDRKEHQAELALFDRETRRTVRLTTSPEDEVTPVWSPDGTRIAFRRYFQTQRRDPETCVRTVEEGAERCEFEGLPSATEPVTWIDASTLLVQLQTTKDLYRVDVDRGRATFIGRPTGAVNTLLGGTLIICQCLDPASLERRLMIAPVSNPMALRTVTEGARVLPPLPYAAERAPRPWRYLQRLEFDSPALEVPLDASTVVLVRGTDNTGAPIQVRARHFSSSDTTVVGVTDDGTVRPVSIGTAWVRVSAGGWRTDSTAVTVVGAIARVVRVERWMNGFAPHWKLFGNPAPTIVATSGGPAFSPNGDGVYASGAYLDESVPTSRGVGVRFEIQVPVTKGKFQSISAGLYADPDADSLQAWDHVTGAGPIPRATGCATGFPPNEGGFGALRFGIFSARDGTTYSEREPARDFYSERWHTIELQYTPDGRCALWVDGEQVVRMDQPARVPARVRFAISGQSKGARVLVRGVEVWEGGRGGAREP